MFFQTKPETKNRGKKKFEQGRVPKKILELALLQKKIRAQKIAQPPPANIKRSVPKNWPHDTTFIFYQKTKNGMSI